MKNATVVLFTGLVLFGCVTTPESGRNALILTSSEDEKAIGVQAFQQILKEQRRSTNARWTGILQRVGQRIAAAARQSDFQWEFVLFESKEKNAFCLPGGKVGFYTGIYSVAQNEAALAAVMGHEVAHATARHAGQRMTLAFGTQLALEGVNVILGGGKSKEKQVLFAALGVGTTLAAALPFSRAHESEADQIGMIYMARAGYDPQEAARFWQRFSSERQLPKFLSTHPPSEERMAALTAQLPEVLPIYRRSAQYGLGEAL